MARSQCFLVVVLTIHPKIREKMLEILFGKDKFEALNQPSFDELEEMRKDFSVFNIQNLQIDRPLLITEKHLKLYTFSGTRINRTIQLLLNIAGIKNILDDSSSEFNIEVSKQELLEKWNSLTQPFSDIDNHISILLQTFPALLDFSKWGKYLPLPFQVKLIKDKYFDIINTEKLLTLLRPVENTQHFSNNVSKLSNVVNIDFITIDFETATTERDSPCEIGLTFVKNKQIIDTKSWLIKPRYSEFNHFNVLIHGIKPEHVADQPEFNELWKEIRPLIENQFLIAHNASFDINVLRSTLETYKLPFPTLNYSCSYIFSKKVWPGLPAYDLNTLCKINNISFNHHRAGEDSRATAELVLKAFDDAGVTSLNDFPEKLKTTIGQLYDNGYRPSETIRIYKPKEITKVISNPAKSNPDSIFYGRTVVFTGTLSSMVRIEAQQRIIDIGGFIGNSITKDTDFLIVGQQDYRVVSDDGMSSKQEKAIQLIENGSDLEILSEDDFLKNL